jgi:hypothetical protein
VIATSGYNEVAALRRFGEGLSGFIQNLSLPGIWQKNQERAKVEGKNVDRG